MKLLESMKFATLAENWQFYTQSKKMKEITFVKEK